MLETLSDEMTNECKMKVLEILRDEIPEEVEERANISKKIKVGDFETVLNMFMGID